MTAAASAAPGDKREVLLIDLSGLFWSAWFSSAEDGISQARRRTLEAVYRCIGDRNDRLVAVCCDSGRSFRAELYPEYKANRPEKDHAAIAELAKVREKLTADGFLLWGVKGFEADDVIATAAQLAVERGHEVLVASGDKDLLQLVSDEASVRVLRTANAWPVCREAEVVAKFGVLPEQLGDWLALVGDKSDNIRGVPGVGEKTAAELLKRYGTLEAIFRALEKQPETVSKPSVVRALLANGEDLKLARRLVALATNVPIDFAEIYERRQPAATTAKEETDMDAPHATFDSQAADDSFVRFAEPAINGATVASQSAPAAPPATASAPLEGTVVSRPQVATERKPAETALVRMPEGTPYNLQLEPVSIGQVFKLAAALFESRLYTRFPTPQSIAAVIMRGREMGVSALTALDCFHIIEGKPSPIAHFLIARAEADPDCEYFTYVDGDATFAEYETKHRRKPKVIKLRYTIQQAIDAGRCTAEIAPRDWSQEKDRRSQWDKSRPELLRKTCGVQLGRLVYPGAILGLYAAEELSGGGDE